MSDRLTDAELRAALAMYQNYPIIDYVPFPHETWLSIINELIERRRADGQVIERLMSIELLSKNCLAQMRQSSPNIPREESREELGLNGDPE